MHSPGQIWRSVSRPTDDLHVFGMFAGSTLPFLVFEFFNSRLFRLIYIRPSASQFVSTNCCKRIGIGLAF